SFLGTISAWTRGPKQRGAAHPCQRDCRCIPVCPDTPLLFNFAKLCLPKRGEIIDTESSEVVEYSETELGNVIDCGHGKARILCLVAKLVSFTSRPLTPSTAHNSKKSSMKM